MKMNIAHLQPALHRQQQLYNNNNKNNINNNNNNSHNLSQKNQHNDEHRIHRIQQQQQQQQHRLLRSRNDNNNNDDDYVYDYDYDCHNVLLKSAIVYHQLVRQKRSSITATLTMFLLINVLLLSGISVRTIYADSGNY